MGDRPAKLRNAIIITAALCLIILAGCYSALTKEEADGVARKFIREKVVFYSRNNQSKQNVQGYSLILVNAIKANGKWAMSYDAVAKVGNETKKSRLSIVIDAGNGKPLMLNNKRIG